MNQLRAGLRDLGLYHSFRLPDGRHLPGILPLEALEARLASFGLPADLTGQRVLDIGPWDGYFTFELERRGAQVVAIDYVDLDTFRQLHRLFGSRAEYRQQDVYELDPREHGHFDIVLCLGVLYHLKHPLLALEKICAVTRGVCIVESFVIDAPAGPVPHAEFYETDELRGQLDNWTGPTPECLAAWIRAAGFARAEFRRSTGDTACFAAHRHWPRTPAEAPATTLAAVSSHLHRGRTFQSHKEEYLVLWCPWAGGVPPLGEVFPEVDGFGVAPLSCLATPGGVTVNLRLPPGLSPGRHQVAVRLAGLGLSNAVDFFVDLPPLANALELVSVQDGATWTDGQVAWVQGGWLTAWVRGLSPEADAGNVVVAVGGVPHHPAHLEFSASAEAWQLNVQLRPVVAAGVHDVTVAHRGAVSRALAVRVIGESPGVHGVPG